ncbi:MAG: NADP-dependent phosphogluconate dehydrogenase [Paracoccaceae bacterium]|nr:NADP-dependent phosphogluconate dehydrogenase [Paracoccaceae bacterium]
MTAQIGIYGLGTMGSALALNMAEKGIQIAVANRSADAVPAFLDEASPLAQNITGHENIAALIQALPTPRLLLAMIPSTAPMDAFLDDVIGLLQPGDTVIDAGNADFHDTRARAQRLAQHDMHFVGLGVSGGEDGARHGPSMMMGGTTASWERLQPILEPIAARHQGDPCVAHLGSDGAGHFVKTVHNGIEYAEMQMIAEICELLRHGMSMPLPDVADLFGRWSQGALASYLVEITETLLRARDPATGQPMVDVILDSAGQKGTGRWTVIEAVRLGQSATMIEGAVAGRAWSAERPVRAAAEAAVGGERQPLDLSPETLEQALLAARLLGYAQGFRILDAASEEFAWRLPKPRIAEIWRAGCIIRSAMLDDISAAFRAGPPHGQLLLAPAFGPLLANAIPHLRQVVSAATAGGYAIPSLASALTWYDSMRQSRGTAAIIQGQRDIFGRHGFARIDMEGAHHGPWWDER